MIPRIFRLTVPLILVLSHAAAQAVEQDTWKIGTPIVTYFAGPAMNDAVATQMADGHFNVVWCGEKDLDLLQKHGLRGMLHDALISPASLDDGQKQQKLDELIDRVRRHPAIYSY